MDEINENDNKVAVWVGRCVYVCVCLLFLNYQVHFLFKVLSVYL